MAGADDFLAIQADFDEVLGLKDTRESRKQVILQHFSKIDKNSKCFRNPSFDKGIIPSFDKDLEWLNVSSPLQFYDEQSLQGKVVVLDFFTYCCVNCLHVLPDLHRLEQRFSPLDGLCVVGVHSAKFLNEKVTANILSAVLRYDITHPVVNDSDTSLWQQLSIMCWPTFVIVGPEGQVLYYIVGEGHSELLFELVEAAMEHYRDQGKLSPHALPFALEREKQGGGSPVMFPGKVHAGPGDDQLVVSDTGHHRLLVLDRVTGVVQSVIGGKGKGLKDGDLEEALFDSPQGVASLGNLLFVADTENHALRQVDLDGRTVITLAGTGVQGDDKQGGQPGHQQPLSTPWDVATGISPGGEKVDVVYIAMAGTHQIWAYFLQDVTWWKNKQYKAGTCACVVGSGNEENRNNSYPDKAALAQPSGLAVSPLKALDTLFVADSESSTVRAVSLKDGSVKGLVGGDRDPRNLFAYGDVDGSGMEAKLQHPLAVSLLSPSGPLLLADSYNHKIKCVDIQTKQCSTVLGAGLPGPVAGGDGADVRFNEPGGLCVDEKKQLVYIADTNNHCIRILDWKTKTVSELPVVFSKDSSSRVGGGEVALDTAALNKGTPLPDVVLQSGAHLQVNLDLRLAPGLHGNKEAPNSWTLSAADKATRTLLNSMPSNLTKGSLSVDAQSPETLTSFRIDPNVTANSFVMVLTCQVFVCHQDNTCTQHRQLFVQRVTLSPNGANKHISLAVLEI
ncbi:hypothetical protein ACOMHN_046842 [Nucella lapillus]